MASTSNAANKRAETPSGFGSKSEQEVELSPLPPPLLLTLSYMTLHIVQNFKQVLTIVHDYLFPKKSFCTESVPISGAIHVIPLVFCSPP